MLRSSIVVVTVVCFATACIAQPSFDTSNTDPSGSATGTAPEMVLVPATTLNGATVSPAHHKPGHTNGNGDGKGKGKDKGKGKGNGKCNGGGPGGGGPGGGGPPSGGATNGDCGNPDGSSGDANAGGGADPNPGSSSGAPPPDTGSGSVVASFWIDAREVSVREYSDCVSAGRCSAAGAGAGCTAVAGLGEHPVTCVTRAQASAFCAWKQKRLVRHLEWSAAAAGSSSRAFPWGSEGPSSERLNACGAECAPGGMYDGRDAFATTAPCGSFPLGRSPDGVFDLAGNVAEWVDADVGLVRGGSYADVDASAVAASAARSVSADAAEPTIGFRCARDDE